MSEKEVKELKADEELMTCVKRKVKMYHGCGLFWIYLL